MESNASLTKRPLDALHSPRAPPPHKFARVSHTPGPPALSLEDLPTEVLVSMALGCMECQSVLSLAMSGIRFSFLADHEWLWSRMYERDFGTHAGVVNNYVHPPLIDRDLGPREVAPMAGGHITWGPLDLRNLDRNFLTAGYPSWKEAYMSNILLLALLAAFCEKRCASLAVAWKEKTRSCPDKTAARGRRAWHAWASLCGEYCTLQGRWLTAAASLDSTMCYVTEGTSVMMKVCGRSIVPASPKDTLGRLNATLYRKACYILPSCAVENLTHSECVVVGGIHCRGPVLVFVPGSYDGVHSFDVEPLKAFVREASESIDGMFAEVGGRVSERMLPKRVLAVDRCGRRLVWAKYVYDLVSRGFSIAVTVLQSPAVIMNGPEPALAPYMSASSLAGECLPAGLGSKSWQKIRDMARETDVLRTLLFRFGPRQDSSPTPGYRDLRKLRLMRAEQVKCEEGKYIVVPPPVVPGIGVSGAG